jgi:hypothetical protein
MVANVVGKMNGKVWAELPADEKPGAIFAIELARA